MKKNNNLDENEKNNREIEKTSSIIVKGSLSSKIQGKIKDERLRCRDISPELCEVLRNREFTNNKEDVFLEVRTIEEHYRYRVETAKVKWERKIKETKRKLEKKYKAAIKDKEREINRDIEDLENEIEKSIKSLEIKENMILSQIDMLYKINKPQLTEDALKILGLNYLCMDKK
ncbi:MAG: hypothetical protein K9W44_15885 [Candidatus Lokiarchaeota archaeon]|nr:hypothetical protein [Candidatus Harpocratesius repetitus]